MNQILYNKDDFYFKKNKNHNKYKTFIMIFSFTLIILIIFLYFYFENIFNQQKEIYKSSSLSDTIKIQTIYNKNNNYYTNIYPIIGRISIDKININYPIFSHISDDLLKIGICKIYGPSINNNGNLCLAGHNYENNLLFSNLSYLQNNDIITISDNNNNSINYYVYNTFEVSDNDTSILTQNIYSKEITLVTCNNFTKNRFVVKAKEIE